MLLDFLIHCAGCGMPMLLPQDMLQPRSFGRGASSTDADVVAVACFQCKTLRTYFLRPGHPQHNPMDVPMVVEHQDKETVRLDMLQCEQRGCGLQLRAVAQWNPSTTAAERRADIESLQWENLICPAGHPIQKLADF
jgi:hypothetical protein